MRYYETKPFSDPASDENEWMVSLGTLKIEWKQDWTEGGIGPFKYVFLAPGNPQRRGRGSMDGRAGNASSLDHDHGHDHGRPAG